MSTSAIAASAPSHPAPNRGESVEIAQFHRLSRNLESHGEGTYVR
jgi:hypothetical protein